MTNSRRHESPHPIAFDLQVRIPHPRGALKNAYGTLFSAATPRRRVSGLWPGISTPALERARVAPKPKWS